MEKTRLVATIIAVTFYAVLIGINFDPAVTQTMTQAFGPEIFGLPVRLGVIVVETILYLPAPFFFWHCSKITTQAVHDMGFKTTSKFRLIMYFFTVGSKYPELRSSQLISLGGLLYFVLLAAAWIIYAALRGI